MFMFNI